MGLLDGVEISDPSIFQNYNRNADAKEAYENSPQKEADENTNAAADAQVNRSNQVIDQVEQEETQKEEGSLLMMPIRIGGSALLNTVNELDRFTGLTDGAEKYFGVDLKFGDSEQMLPTPEDLGISPEGVLENLASAGFQYIIPGLGAIKTASKVTTALNILKNSPKAKGILDVYAGSAAVSASLVNPKHDNAANMVLDLGWISEDAVVGSAVKKWLAIDPNDSDAYNRAKNVVLDATLAASLGGLISLFKKVKGTTKTPTKAELKAFAKAQSEGTVEALERMAKDNPEQAAKLRDSLPDDARRAEDFKISQEPETVADALARSAKETGADPLNKYHQTPSPARNIRNPLYQASKEEDAALDKLVNDVLEGKLPDLTDPMLPINLNKIDSAADIKSLIHGMGRIFESKLPKNIKMDDLTETQASIMGATPSEIRQVAESTEYSRGYVIASRVTQIRTAREWLSSMDEYMTKPTIATEFKMHTARLQAKEAVTAGSSFSTATGRLLNEFKNVGKLSNAADTELLWRQEVLNKLVEGGDEALLNARRTRKVANQPTAAELGLEEAIEYRTGKALFKARYASSRELNGLMKYLNKQHNVFGRTRESIMQIYVNGLLSSPKTQLINFFGNMTSIGSSIIERGVAASLNRSGADGVTFREAMRLVQGTYESTFDIWRIFSKAWKEGPQDHYIKNDLTRHHENAISKEFWGVENDFMGGTIDMLGTFVNWPGRLLLAADDVFKHINYTGELKAISFSKALQNTTKKLGRAPKSADEMAQVTKDADQLVERVPEDLHEQAMQYARVNTFTQKQPKGFTKNIQSAIHNDVTGLVKTAVPFFNTPMNLLRFSGERIPGLSYLSKAVRDEFHSPNPRIRQLAIAKWGTGTSLIGLGTSLSMNGLVTGPAPLDPDLRRRYEDAGIPAYSIWYKGKYYRYDRFDPLAKLFTFGSVIGTLNRTIIDLDGHETKHGVSTELLEARDKAWATAGISMFRMVTDSSYLQGVGSLVDMFAGEMSQERIEKMFSPNKLFIPYSSLRDDFVKAYDPRRKEKIRNPVELRLNETLAEHQDRRHQANIDRWTEETLRLIPGWGAKPELNMMGDPSFHRGSSANEELHFGPVAILKRLAHETLNVAPGIERSKSFLMNKLAELNIAEETPSRVKSIDGVELRQEEHRFYAQTLGRFNKELEKDINTKDFNKMSETEQRFDLEFRLKHNRKIARLETKSQFKRIFEQSMDNMKEKLEKPNQGDIPGNLFGRQ
tara:strand:+ start:3416 stop:7162 length:3747 start_codon:yes stop_codon:yes gene_type:complete